STSRISLSAPRPTAERSPSWEFHCRERRPRTRARGEVANRVDLAASLLPSALASQVIEDLGHHAAVDLVVTPDFLHDRRFAQAAAARARIGGGRPRAGHRPGTVGQALR